MQKTSNKKLNLGIMLLVVLLIIFVAMITIVIIETTKERKEVIVLPDYSSTEIEKDVLLGSGKLYTVGKADFITGLSYSAKINSNAETNIVSYIVNSTIYKIGDIVEKDESLGEFENVSVNAKVRGKVVDVYYNEELDETNVVLLNNESYFVEFFVPEKDRNKFNYDTKLTVGFDKYQFNAEVVYIGYELSSQGIQIKATVLDENFILIKGLSVSVTRITNHVENALVISRSAISIISNFRVNSFQVLNAPSLFAASSGGGNNYPSTTTPSTDYSTFSAQTVNVTVAKQEGDYFVLSTRSIIISAINDDYCLIASGLSEGETVFVAF